MDRNERARLGLEALEISRAGFYTMPSGQRVDISVDLKKAVEGTRTFAPGAPLPPAKGTAFETIIEVTGETTLGATRRLAISTAPSWVMLLNFASAKNPGGGFLKGARAQEESIAMSSALYECIFTSPMYEINKRFADCIYTDHVIYSPAVPIFRDESGCLLGRPYNIAMLTAPAANAGVVLERDPSRSAEVENTMRRRAVRVLEVARSFGHGALVLGAWGCGVFKNDPVFVARTFRELLGDTFKGAFERVVFAIPGLRGDPNLEAFMQVFLVPD
jgi:uncharacterized protein (TIGR02452 family)